MRPLANLTAEQRGWADWLRTFRWDWWVTGTWATPLGDPLTAVRIATQWLTRAGPSAYAAVGVQRGPLADRLHVHLVVGGTGTRPLMATRLRRSWVKKGHLLVARYTPTRGAIEYLVAQADEIELVGTPQAYHPRSRGSRGGH